MRARFQNGCLAKEKRKSGAVWIFRHRDAQNINRKQIVGTVERYPTKAAARKASECFRINININNESYVPRTFTELIAHYAQKELAENGNKAYSTRAAYESCIKTWIAPKWGNYRVADVKAVAVEDWLSSLDLANGSKAKIRNIMYSIFEHAVRYEWTGSNPISHVRQSAKREHIPEVLGVNELKALLLQLKQPYRTAVFLAAVTGLRVSELLALQWQDFRWNEMEIQLERGIVHQHVGRLKTEASKRPLPMDTRLCEVLVEYRNQTAYNQEHDWLFASPDMDGTQPYWPDSLMRKVIRPAAVRAGISKHIGWHTFRHTYATLLKANGEDVKTVQESLRHANSKITLDTYTQGLMPVKRLAQGKVIQAIQAAGIQ
jgi:integrase